MSDDEPKKRAWFQICALVGLVGASLFGQSNSNAAESWVAPETQLRALRSSRYEERLSGHKALCALIQRLPQRPWESWMLRKFREESDEEAKHHLGSVFDWMKRARLRVKFCELSGQVSKYYLCYNLGGREVKHGFYSSWNIFEELEQSGYFVHGKKSGIWLNYWPDKIMLTDLSKSGLLRKKHFARWPEVYKGMTMTAKEHFKNGLTFTTKVSKQRHLALWIIKAKGNSALEKQALNRLRAILTKDELARVLTQAAIQVPVHTPNREEWLNAIRLETVVENFSIFEREKADKPLTIKDAANHLKQNFGYAKKEKLGLAAQKPKDLTGKRPEEKD